MQRASTRNPPQRSSGGERVFTDDEGRLWSAALEERDEPGGALVFRCISDGRQSVRALAVALDVSPTTDAAGTEQTSDLS